MWNLNYSSRAEIVMALKRNGLYLSKKFGQNFLTEERVRERIVSLMNLEEGMDVWEVGPGLGSITALILKERVNLTAFEIDYGFSRVLKEEAFKDEENFSIVEGDALKTVMKMGRTPDRIVGNLPYNAGSSFIAKLIENSILPERMVFTLQLEVAKRMESRAGEEDYSSFSVLTQMDYLNKTEMKIGPDSFFPAPQVDSAVVTMKRRDKSLVPDNTRAPFMSLLRTLFSERRKTVKNNLSKFQALGKDRSDEILRFAGIDPMERVERLSTQEILRILESIEKS